MDLLITAKKIADRVEAESLKQNVPVAVTVIDTIQKGVRLSDLAGAVGYPELRYRDSITVEHRGEQRDLVVLVSPCTAHYLPVDRDYPLVVPALPGLREKPRAGYHVQLGRIDPGQHAPYRRRVRLS